MDERGSPRRASKSQPHYPQHPRERPPHPFLPASVLDMRQSHPNSETLLAVRRVCAALSSAIFLTAACFLSSGCQASSTESVVATKVVRYRETIEQILKQPSSETQKITALKLPDRSARRMEVADQRITPLDFLSIIGCPLSGIVAERNAPLGKVLVPTRRLAHEWLVLEALEACLPGLKAARAERLRAQLNLKRAERPLHQWNGVWLDRDLERFLSSGPPSLMGGKRSGDGPQQLLRAAEALKERDASALEGAFEQLRDDPAMGPRLRALDTVARELKLVANLIEEGATTVCDRRDRQLLLSFREDYMPLQASLGMLDRSGREDVEGLAALFRATSQAVDMSKPMERFRFAVLGSSSDGFSDGVWARFRQGSRSHATAWGPVIEGCGGMPSPLS